MLVDGGDFGIGFEIAEEVFDGVDLFYGGVEAALGGLLVGGDDGDVCDGSHFAEAAAFGLIQRFAVIKKRKCNAENRESAEADEDSKPG